MPDSVDRTARTIRRSHALASVESEDRVAILDLDHIQRPPMILEGTAARIWKLLDGTRTEGDVASDLVASHHAPPESIAVDVASFVGQLRDIGLVQDPGAADTLTEVPLSHDR
jgi:hypothetical protein